MKKLIAFAIVALMASPAFAAIQNVKVSGDITSTYVDRYTFNLGTTLGSEGLGAGGVGFKPVGLKKQNVFITQTRLRVDADLSDNVSTTVGLINERAWGGEGTFATGSTQKENTDVQLYLASVTMRELLYSPLTVTVGRQIFNYGNGLIMGDGGVNNQATGDLQFIAQDLTMRTAYDGVKAVLDYKPLTIDMFYFKNNQTLVNGNPISDNSSSDVYGFNANYQLGDSMNTVFETYMFSRIDGNNQAGVTSNKGNNLFVPGLRASTNPVKGLNVQGELAWQLGNKAVITTVNGNTDVEQAEKRTAMAAQFLTSYALPVEEKYKPTVNASYTYVSGDKDSTANYGSVPFSSAKTYSAWDPFNENQGSGTIYNTLFPLSNMHIVSVGASVNPLEDVTAAFSWSGLWDASTFGPSNKLAIFQPDGGGATINPASKGGARGLGDEYDVNLTYNYTEDVTFGVSLGWFVPGNVFTSNNNNTASQALADVAVKF